jgi:hypothetical protein
MSSVSRYRDVRKAGNRQFMAALDPGLLLQPAQTGPSRGQEAAASLDKGKGRAGSDGGSRDGHITTPSTALHLKSKRPVSRTKALAMSADSPKFIRSTSHQADVAAVLSDSTGTTTTASSTSHSTIESFGASRSIAFPVKEAIPVEERNVEASGSADSGRRKLIEEMEKRTIYGSKRRRLEKEARLEALQTLPSARSSTEKILLSEPGPADQLWKSIWGRWDDAPPEHHPSLEYPHLPRQEPQVSPTSSKRIPGEMGDSLLMSQKSQVSTQSEDGQFRSQFSFYHFSPESVMSPTLNKDTNGDAVSPSAADIDDTSRSRIDVDLLAESSDESQSGVAGEGGVMPDDTESGIQDRVDVLCRESGSEMRKVKHVIFRGKALQGEKGYHPSGLLHILTEPIYLHHRSLWSSLGRLSTNEKSTWPRRDD